MGLKSNLKELFADLDTPIQLEEKTGFLKKGKYEIILIFEDGSYKTFFVKLKKSYSFVIKKRRYLIVPECILRGKRPKLIYYFNNPFPLLFEYQISKVSALDLYEKEELSKMPYENQIQLSKVRLDSEALHNLLTTNLIKGLYPRTAITPKGIIIIFVVVFIAILILLHLFGVIDITSFLVAKPN